MKSSSGLCIVLSQIRCEPLRWRTCAGVRLLSVDLQEDKCREEQQPAAGLIRGFSQRGPPALRGRVQDAAKAATSVRRGKQWGRWGTGGRGKGAACLQRPQCHRERSAGGRRHGRCPMIFLYDQESFMCPELPVIFLSDSTLTSLSRNTSCG